MRLESREAAQALPYINLLNPVFLLKHDVNAKITSAGVKLEQVVLQSDKLLE